LAHNVELKPENDFESGRGPGRPGGDESRARIIEAAGRLFAARSFNGVSVRELARAAKVNAAAISYHFGGKEGLYESVLAQLVADTGPIMEPLIDALDRGVAEAKGDRERLARVAAGFIQRLLSGVLLRRSHVWQMPLMLREFQDPSAGFAMVVRERIDPVHDAIARLVAAATGVKAGSPEAKLLAANFMGQCMMFGATRALIFARLGWTEYTPDHVDLIARTLMPRMLAALGLPDCVIGERACRS